MSNEKLVHDALRSHFATDMAAWAATQDVMLALTTPSPEPSPHACGGDEIGPDDKPITAESAKAAFHKMQSTAPEPVSLDDEGRALLEELTKAEAHYRRMHDMHGRGDMKTGRAWDQMRRAGDKAKAYLTRPAQSGEQGQWRGMEPVAVRYGFDGYGYRYIDSGSGSDWQTRHPDGELLYTPPPEADNGEG